MEYVIFAFSALTLIFSAVIMILFIKNGGASHSGGDISRLIEQEKENNAKINELNTLYDSLSKTVSREFSSNRQEMSRNIDSQSERISALTESNYRQMQNISNEISERLIEIMGKTSEQTEKITATLSESVKNLTQENDKKIEEIRQTVSEKLDENLTSKLNSSFAAVSENLKSLYNTMGEMKNISSGVNSNISSLSRILTNVKSRGTWAEYQLKAILDDIVPGMYVSNYHPSSLKGNEVVEFAVKIPLSANNGYRLLPIDSKFPLEDYQRLVSSAEEGDAEKTESARKALMQRVKDEAKLITKYINPPETVNFAVMYLATEGLYAEVMNDKSGVQEKIKSDYKILIAGPSTISALLNTIAMGYSIASINEKASEVQKLLEEVRRQYDIFSESLRKVRKNLDSASSNLESAEKRNEIIKNKLKNAGSIDGGKEESETAILNQDGENGA